MGIISIIRSMAMVTVGRLVFLVRAVTAVRARRVLAVLVLTEAEDGMAEMPVTGIRKRRVLRRRIETKSVNVKVELTV